MALKAMKLKRIETVVYGAAYKKTGNIRADAARSIEKFSKVTYYLAESFRAARGILMKNLRWFNAHMPS